MANAYLTSNKVESGLKIANSVTESFNAFDYPTGVLNHNGVVSIYASVKGSGSFSAVVTIYPVYGTETLGDNPIEMILSNGTPIVSQTIKTGIHSYTCKAVITGTCALDVWVEG